MEYPILSIRDTKTGFMAPTIDTNEHSGIRNFQFAIRNSRDVLGGFPGDFSLYRVGVFNTESGAIVPEAVPVWLADGISALTVKEAEESVG